MDTNKCVTPLLLCIFIILGSGCLATEPQKQDRCASLPFSKAAPSAGASEAQLREEGATLLRRYRNDPLVTVWPSAPEVTNILVVGSMRVYEVACNEFTPFRPLELTQTLLVYEGPQRHLVRLNTQPRYWGVPTGYHTVEDPKSFSAFMHFLAAAYPDNPLTPKKKADALLSLLFHYSVDEFPCIVLTSDDLRKPATGLSEEQQHFRDALEKLSLPEGSYAVLATYPSDNAVVAHVFSFNDKGEIVGLFSDFLQKIHP